MKRVALVLAWGLVLLAARAGSQTISIFDTVYSPPGDVDGSWPATMFVPAVGNGIGAVLLHGSGVNRQTTRGWCDTLAAYGYVAMAIEYSDYLSYPKSPRVAKLAVQFLRRNAGRFGITTNKIIGLGQSYGSITWGQAIIWDNDFRFFRTDSTIDDRLNAAILLYGFYDTDFNSSRDYFNNDSSQYLKGVCIKHVDNITAPVLLLHGTSDQSVPYQGSVQLYDSMIAHGKVCQLVPFTNLPHGFDVSFPDGRFQLAGLTAKDSALAFLRRTVAPTLKIRVSTSLVDFGPLLLSTRDTATLHVENIGKDSLGLQSISVGRPEFGLVNVPLLPLAIQPGGSIAFQVSFHPTAGATVVDTVTLRSDDPLHPAVKVAVRGKGVASMASARSGVLYATSAASTSGQLMSLSPADGTLDTIGPLGVPEIRGMAIRNTDGLLYGTTLTYTPTGLYQINAVTGESALQRRFPVGNLSAWAFGPGDTLYGATTTGTLYRLSLTNGLVDSLGTSAGLSYSGLAFRPGSGELWASVSHPIDSIFKLSTATGTARFVGTTGLQALTSSIAFDSTGKLYGLIDNGSGEDYLATLDTLSAAGTIIAGPLSVGQLRSITMVGGSPLVSVQDPQARATPLKYGLFQNYPNPFNAATRIPYTLPRQCHVKFTIINLLGQKVAELVNGDMGAGYYPVTWNAQNAASGLYFVRMTVTDAIGKVVCTKTNKLLLTR